MQRHMLVPAVGEAPHLSSRGHNGRLHAGLLLLLLLLLLLSDALPCSPGAPSYWGHSSRQPDRLAGHHPREVLRLQRWQTLIASETRESSFLLTGQVLDTHRHAPSPAPTGEWALPGRTLAGCRLRRAHPIRDSATSERLPYPIALTLLPQRGRALARAERASESSLCVSSTYSFCMIHVLAVQMMRAP